MRAIGRGVAATVLAGCVALAVASRGVAETLDHFVFVVADVSQHVFDRVLGQELEHRAPRVGAKE